MNKRILYVAAAVVAAGGMLASCSSDYLEYEPKTDIGSEYISDPANAKGLIDGIYQAMNTQYADLANPLNCGEAQVGLQCGECTGADLTQMTYNDMAKVWEGITINNGYVNLIPWMYYYNIINLSNYIIDGVPATAENYEGTAAELLNYKAQALAMRAHAYTRLLGYFGNRWEDADNGKAYCIVLRTKPGTEDTPLVTMNEVLDQIYDDCDQSVKLFEIAGISRTNMWETSPEVANGVWARAALIKHDWQTAADKARLARANTTVMSESDMLGGFFTDNSETIWSMNPAYNTTYYWSWGSMYSCNGTYILNWGRGGIAINIDLYNKLDPNDSRRKMFWTPDKIAEIPADWNPGKVKAEDFWNPNLVDGDNFLNMNISKVFRKRSKDPQEVGMLNCIAWWLSNYHNNVFTGPKDQIENDDNQYNFYSLITNIKEVQSKNSVPYYENSEGVTTSWINVLPMAFGSSMKFWSIAPYGNMSFPWMRCSEMVLTEAEAEYMLGHETQAKTALSELQSKRISGYTCTTSGDALLDEIRTSRRIELWGEGASFLDLKRWNMPRVRRVWVAEDPTSGNMSPAQFANMDETGIKRMESPKYNNGWRFLIPYTETRYNSAVDLGLLPSIEP